MPFKKGKSKKVVSENISEGMRSYKKKGTFGTSTPPNAEKARSQIVAAALKKAGRSKYS